MCGSACCSIWCCILWGLGWWALASVLLMFTWNKVVTALFTVKTLKFWHSLLVVLTLVVLFGPMCCGQSYRCDDDSYCDPADDCKEWNDCCPHDSLKK